VTDNGEILQTIPQNKSLMQVLIDGGQNGFYIMPKGQPTNPDLSKYVHETQAENIQVTEEEYQIYCEMGSSFQLCKICSENEKDTRIEPCNHLICGECLSQWQLKDQSMTPTCPYCRCEIRGTCRILINPFRNSV
jgi:E3 ubiquitin-protein ligase CBL